MKKVEDGMIVVKDEIYRTSSFDIEQGITPLVTNGTKVVK